MFCKNCGFENKDGAKYCQRCGSQLGTSPNIGNMNSFPTNSQPATSDNKNAIIIGITAIIILIILGGTFLLLSDEYEIPFLSGDNDYEDTNLQVNTATFYLDGNPNSGIPATINVGKEHTGESMEVMTVYSRDGSNLNHPTDYETHVVDDDGNIVITEYSSIPRYPDYCLIEIRYNNNVFKYGCDMGKHKGSQTSVPREITQ